MDELLPHQNFSLEDMEGEIWKDIEGFNGFYEISSLGRVKSLSRETFNGVAYFKIKNRILRPTFRKDGYVITKITFNRKQFTFRNHRLVALYFINNPFNKTDVNHINSNKSDNNIINLEWATRLENMCHFQLKNSKKTSKFTGVCFNKKEKHFEAYIMINTKSICLGRRFKTEEEAYEARCNYEKNNNIENKYL